jgi:hypothetical protein
MLTWTKDELNRIGKAEELEIASLRPDGTLRSRRIIWVVRLGDELYIRSVLGRKSDWFRGVQTRHEGRIWAGGVEKDVSFLEETDLTLNDRIDAVYSAKYHHYPADADAINSAEARTATLRLAVRQG